MHGVRAGMFVVGFHCGYVNVQLDLLAVSRACLRRTLVGHCARAAAVFSNCARFLSQEVDVRCLLFESRLIGEPFMTAYSWKNVKWNVRCIYG